MSEAPTDAVKEPKKQRLFVTIQELQDSFSKKAPASAVGKLLHGAPDALSVSEYMTKEGSTKGEPTGNVLHGAEAIKHVASSFVASQSFRSFAVDETKIPKKLQATYTEAMTLSVDRQKKRNQMAQETSAKVRAEKAAMAAPAVAETPAAVAATAPRMMITRNDIRYALGVPMPPPVEGKPVHGPAATALFLKEAMDAVKLPVLVPVEGKKYPQANGQFTSGKKMLEGLLESGYKPGSNYRQLQVDVSKIPENVLPVYNDAMKESKNREIAARTNKAAKKGVEM